MSPIQFPSKKMKDCSIWEFNGTKNSFSAMMIAWTLDKILQHKIKTICGLKVSNSCYLGSKNEMFQNVSDIPHLFMYNIIVLHMTKHLRTTFLYFMIKIFNFLGPLYFCSNLSKWNHVCHTHEFQLCFILYTLISRWVIVMFKYA